VNNRINTNANHGILSSPPSLLACYWRQVKEKLGPLLQEPPGIDLTQGLHRLAQILEIARIEEHVQAPLRGRRGREEIDRRPIARAFLAKAVLNLTDTRQLIERLHQSEALRALCGMERVPSEPTFSRAFAAFARQDLGDAVHASLVKRFVSGQIVLHVSHDTTAVEAREKPARRQKRIKEQKNGGDLGRVKGSPPKSRRVWSGRWEWSLCRRLPNCRKGVTEASSGTRMATCIAGRATRRICPGRMG
jgi:transposase